VDSDSQEAQRPRAARQLVEQRGVGVLATISTLAVRTSNLAQEPKASLLVFEEEALQDPLSTARVKVMGTVSMVSGSEIDSARAAYLN